MTKKVNPVVEYPHLTCYWRVIFDGEQLSAYEVSGLTEKMEYVSYRRGDDPSGYVSKKLAKPQGGQITIKWGIFSSHDFGAHMFHKWRDDRTYNSDKKVSVDIQVILIDEKDNEVLQWNCKSCTPPLEYIGPVLRADESVIAMQTLVLDVEQIESKILIK